MVQDADNHPLEQINIAFVCPPGFEPAAFLIVALNKQGQSYTNAPIEQPALALRLGTVALDFVSQHAVVHIQREQMKQSPIIQAAAGSIPTWRGPEGRG